ncbi:expressed unknown protein [Seminavis robusta]|uniref:Hint domain-containing protein n=1 Tax=Seminavis robusta TaxID=568900 RepID=A0A9N8ECB0_9STRA|nr:expressed unknown protein [Seminavis robusta]|eukprot:Sro738_g195220.1 n/a (474) ;mRNA; f:4342-5763
MKWATPLSLFFLATRSPSAFGDSFFLGEPDGTPPDDADDGLFQESTHCHSGSVINRCGDIFIERHTVAELSTSGGCNSVADLFQWGCCMEARLIELDIYTDINLVLATACFLYYFWDCVVTGDGCLDFGGGGPPPTPQPTPAPVTIPTPLPPTPGPTPRPTPRMGTPWPTPRPTPRPTSLLPVGGPQPAGICFSKLTTVAVSGKGSISISEVQVGDRVVTAQDSSGKELYETVFALGHYNPSESGDFLQFQVAEADGSTTSKKMMPLEVSASHLVLIHDGKQHAVRADSVKVGDVLQGPQGHGDYRISKIHQVSRQGVFSPLTPSGKLVVNNGIAATGYVAAPGQNSAEHLQSKDGFLFPMSHYSYAHLFIAPFRLVCMGILSSLCTAMDEDGILQYVSTGFRVHGWIEEQNTLVQQVLLVLFSLVCGICMVVEFVFGATYGPLAIFLGIMAWISFIKPNMTNRFQQAKAKAA